MRRNLLAFHFKLFGINHTIPPSNANVVFHFCTISWIGGLIEKKRNNFKWRYVNGNTHFYQYMFYAIFFLFLLKFVFLVEKYFFYNLWN